MADDIFGENRRINFLDSNMSIRQTKDIGLLERLRCYLENRNRENGEKYVIGEWLSHKGIGIAVVKHKVYTLEEAKRIFEENGQYGKDPFFGGGFDLEYFENKLKRLKKIEA